MPSCVLAYSGGLDTSVILGWLMDEGYEVHCLYVDLGQPCEDRRGDAGQGPEHGAASARTRRRARRALPRFRLSRAAWQAKYEPIYLLGTSIARPLITKKCLEVAREVGADALSPTERPARATISADSNWRPMHWHRDVQVIAPWRIEAFRQQFPGRSRNDRLLRARRAFRSRRRSPSHTARTKTACTSAMRQDSWKT